MPPVKPKPCQGAAAKLSLIQREITNVSKSGRNTHQQFSYYKEHNILELLRPYLAEHNLTIVPTFHDLHTEGTYTSLACTITLTDNDLTPEDPRYSIQSTVYAGAVDKVGWGPGKCLTYGYKYALQKLFAIPTDELDEGHPDLDSDMSSPADAVPDAPPPSSDIAATLRADLEELYKGLTPEATATLNSKVQAKLTELGYSNFDTVSAEHAGVLRDFFLAQAGA